MNHVNPEIVRKDKKIRMPIEPVLNSFQMEVKMVIAIPLLSATLEHRA
ncbi:hypothetical protein [Deinococcus humi]|uniref:Uncharacterized protein n=1 Tax=Deinococcus humi TaxID=662880 RepID=A0A7W8JZG2_9DEIO|nr:hypothetical protein [Deinococcus humi]MBB5364773.1 hypothetical protein [Deinococcus humi]